MYKTMMASIAAAAFTITAVPALAQSATTGAAIGGRAGTASELPSFEFRGHKIGDALPDGCQSMSGERSECKDPAYAGMLGDVRVQVLVYDYYQGSLYDMMMTFQKNSYQKIHDMLVGKYGNAASEVVGSVHNQAGAEFQNFTSKWNFKEGTLELNMLALDINTGSLVFHNPAAEAKIQEDQAAKSKVLGATAF